MQENQVEGSEGVPTNSQEFFDHILASAMRILYDEEIVGSVLDAASSTDDVDGLVFATKGIIDKVRVDSKEEGLPIPGDMLPALSLEIMSQIVELYSHQTGDEVPDEVVVGAFQKLVETEVSMGLKSGELTQEDVDSLIEQFKADEQAFNGGGMVGQPQENQRQQPPDMAQEGLLQ